MQTHDLIIIGAGPGGYTAAIRAAQLGWNVGVVEKEPALGGTCLRIGCIPSKALLESSERYHETREALGEHGVRVSGVALDLQTMLSRKDAIVKSLTDGVDGLFRKNKITRYVGHARLTGKDDTPDGPVYRIEVAVSGDGRASKAAGGGGAQTGGGKTALAARHVIVATGSNAAGLRGVELDGDRIGTSTEALSYATAPKHLVVIGAGYIGLELGSVWRRLGARVTVLEYLPRILPGMDAELADLALKTFKKQGLEFRLGARVTAAGVERGATKATTAAARGPVAATAPAKTAVGADSGGRSGSPQRSAAAAGGDRAANQRDDGGGGDGAGRGGICGICVVECEGAEPIRCDRVLVAVGRAPNTDGLGLENVGIQLDERGRMPVNDHFATAAPGIYAIGDVIRGPMLAHKAEDEGIACVEQLIRGYGHVNYDAIPGVVYTNPEIASVGKTEEELKAADVQYRSGVFHFRGNARARALGQTEGRVKILADAATDRVLGVHIIGPRAGDLIAEAAVAIEFGASSEDIARCSHAHPTLAEAVREAALAVDGRAINS